MDYSNLDLGKYQLGWSDAEDYVFKSKKGLSEAVVREISAIKNEPDWMRDFRLAALRRFERRPMAAWFAVNMPDLDFDDIYYYLKPTESLVREWSDLPDAIKDTYEKLGIPESERKYLAGVTAQYDSEAVFHRNRADLEEMGVIFTDMDTAVREYPDLVKKYFGTVIPPNDNKFAALNSAVWSGGSFIYVPPGVKVDAPLQAYFRINAQNMGQFERTLIIADEGSQVQYFEGCLIKGEKINLANGTYCPVEQVSLGDTVLDSKGRPTPVMSIMRREYSGVIHTITPFSSHNAITVTSEHPLMAIRRADVATSRSLRLGKTGALWKSEVSTNKLKTAKPQWVRADEIEEGDFLFYPEQNAIPAPPLHPAFMRLAGYYLAEGSASIINNCKALVFSFHEDETDYIEEVGDLCEALWGKRGSVHNDPDKHSSTVIVYTDGGYLAMSEHVGTRSSTKVLSNLIVGQSPELLADLIDSYVNGDGNRSDSRTDSDGTVDYWIRCNTVSPGLALQLQSILSRLGVFATARMERVGGPGEIIGRSIVRKNLYTVQWRATKNPGEIRKIAGGWAVPVKCISRREWSGDVYNLETVANTYCVSGFATHNCSAPIYSTDSLHSAVVELVALDGSRITYTTIQNWSNNVYNLVTKRARAEAEAHVQWYDLNIGSRLTMKYPSVYLMGPKASGEVLSVAYAGAGQHQDAGAKMVHAAPETTSTIINKSVSKGGGKTTYRGLVHVDEGAKGAKSFVQCDALLLDDESVSQTLPYMEVGERDASIGHEATVSKVADDQLFYLMSRGLSKSQAMGMIVNGFIEPVARVLPIEYGVELTRLIELELDETIG